MPKTSPRGASSRLDFLSGGGEMGALMRATDWRATSLGPVEEWPQSLRSALSICLGSSFQIAIYWGPDLNLLYNDAWSPIPGQKHPQALGRPAREVWPEIWETIGPMFAQVFATGEATRSKDALLAMHRHGFTEECYFDYTFSPIRGEDGSVGGIFNAVVETTFRVIGERRTRLLRDLGEKAAHAQDVAQACAAATSVLSRAGEDLPFCVIYLGASDDPQSLELTASCGLQPGSRAAPVRLGPGDAGVWPIKEAWSQGRATPVRLADVAALAGEHIPGGPWPEACDTAVIVPLAPPGTLEFTGALVAGVSPRLALDGEYLEFVTRVAAAIAAAIARGQALEYERKRVQALAEIDRAKTTFFSNVSHELRTPLTLMLGPLQDLLTGDRGSVSPDARALLEVAQRNGARLLKLVNALLDFSRIEAGRIHAQFERIDIGRFTRDLASVFRSAMERAGLELHVECDDVASPVYVDRQMWETIVLNLLSNALKYTMQGAVRLRLSEEDDAVVLSVADTGSGIPATELPRIFERFYRVPNATGRTHEGTGIGLALIQELVRLHGGTIGAESTLGTGTTFTVRIPVGSNHLPAQQVKAGSSRQAVSSAATAYVAEAERWIPDADSHAFGDGELPTEDGSDASAETHGTVLLADDNADMRDYVRGLLARRFEVVTAANGEEALALARRRAPDLVVTDVMMPKLDGFGLLQAIREDEHLKEVPVILLSARAGEEARVEGMERGADDYLVKPFSARELQARVAAQLNLARMRREAQQALREADRRKDEFLATLAHELRNPLAPIRQAAHIASKPNVTEAQLRWSNEIIARQTQHMAMLLDDLLDVSRITRGRLELRKAPVELAAVIDTAVETARPAIEARRHRLRVSLPEEPVRIVVDAVRIAQAVSNLLTNSAKYTDAGGEILVRAVREPGTLRISVRDNGIGIPPEKLSSVFEMFSQLQSAIERSEGGLGIGLALVKGVVQLHGGTVAAASDGPGRGSEFTIRLPVVEAAPSASPRITQPQVVNGAGRALKVLVVDDNRDGAETLAALMAAEGHDVRIAFDGEHALGLAADFRPDIALLDIGMPKLNGYELAQRVRADANHRDTYLVAVTGWGQAEDKRAAERAGFDSHLTKPVELEALQALLQNAATRRPAG